MGMDKNIKYVREKRVAPLLNDMVMHLLASTPAEPLTSLIQYLERRDAQAQAGMEEIPGSEAEEAAAPVAAPQEKSAAAVKPEEPPAKQEAPPQQEAKQPAQEESAPQPEEKKPAAVETKPTPVEGTPSTIAPAQPPLDSDRMTRPEPKLNEMEALMKELQDNEQNFLQLLAAEGVDDPMVAQAIGVAVSTSQQLQKDMRLVSENATLVNMGVEQVGSGLKPREFLSKKAFEVLDELELNNGDVTKVFRSVKFADITDPELADVYTQAMVTHSQIRDLIDEAQITQMQIEAETNKGSVGAGAALCLESLVHNISQTVANAKVNLAKAQLVVPQAARPEPEDVSKMPLDKQFTVYLSEFLANESKMWEALKAVKDTRAEESATEAFELSDASFDLAVELMMNNSSLMHKAAHTVGGTMKDLKDVNQQVVNVVHQLKVRSELVAARMGAFATQKLTAEMLSNENTIAEVLKGANGSVEENSLLLQAQDTNQQISTLLKELETMQKAMIFGVERK